MNKGSFNAETAFLHKHWSKQLYKYDLDPGSITMMPRPPGGSQLGHFIEYLSSSGIDVLVSMLQFEEAKSLSLINEGSECESHNIEFINFPIQDHNVPQFFLPFNQLVTKLANDVKHGKNIAVHCYAGIGRTGLLASSILIKLGMEVDFSLINLSQCRGLRVPETIDQITWLHHHFHQLSPNG